MTPSDTKYKRKPVDGPAKNERCRAVERKVVNHCLAVYFIRHDLTVIAVCLVCVHMGFGSQPGHIHENAPRVDRQAGLGIGQTDWVGRWTDRPGWALDRQTGLGVGQTGWAGHWQSQGS